MSKILVIEDAAIIREPIQAALQAAGYEVTSTADGTQALQLLETVRPDLVLLDINLSGIDGLSLLQHIRSTSHLKWTPVVMLTAVAEKQRVLSAMKLGISAYLLKSRFSLKEMLEQVQKYLAAPENRLNNDSAESGKPSPPSPQSLSNASAPIQPSHPQQPNVPVAIPNTVPEIDADADPMETLKSLKPLVSRSEIAEKLEQCAELKGLSPAVSQVLRLTGTDRCSIEQVAKAISQDHAIALKVLKLANSAVYTRGEPVDSVHMAVSRIGLGQIRQTVLNLAVIDQFNAQASSRHINFGQFWEHAIAVGIIAAELAHALEQDADAAFTMGLLHDVGRMFLADQFEGMYDQVLETASQLKLPYEVVESRMLLYNHADVMDRVLHSWKFPKQLINPIVFHHLSAGNIRRAAPRQITEVTILALANRIAHALMLGSSGNEAIYSTIEMCEMLKIDFEVMRTIHDRARDETDKVKFALLATSSTANWPQLREVHRRAVGPFKPLFVSESPAIDAYRMFCEELTNYEEDDSPNIGIIHITNARERISTTAAFRAAEEMAQVKSLPLIVLSPAKKLLPENSLLAGRRYEAIATPLTIEKFIVSARALLTGGVSAAAA